MPLAFVKTGQKVVLSSIQAGWELKARMNSLGLIPGIEIEVIQNNNSGPFMIKIKDNKIALGRGIALKLFVQ
jgi:ferrous iron transport protein A